MAFGLSGHGLKSFATYDAALAYYNETKPWRDEPVKRPMRHRRNKHLWIRKDVSGRIECGYHRTPLVTWYPEGIVEIGRHDSASTATFIAYVGPYGIRASMVKRCLTLYVGGKQYQGNGLQFQRDEANCRWVLLNPDKADEQYEYTLNKEKAKLVRRTVKPFLDYVSGAQALGVMPDYSDASRFYYSWVTGIRRVLATLQPGDTIPLDDYPSLYRAHNYSPKDFLPMAYGVMGAIDCSQLPVGQLPSDTSRKWGAYYR